MFFLCLWTLQGASLPHTGIQISKFERNAPVTAINTRRQDNLGSLKRSPRALSGPKPSPSSPLRSLPPESYRYSPSLATSPAGLKLREGSLLCCGRELSRLVDVEHRRRLPPLVVVGGDRDGEAPGHGGERRRSQAGGPDGRAAAEEARGAGQPHQRRCRGRGEDRLREGRGGHGGQRGTDPIPKPRDRCWIAVFPFNCPSAAVFSSLVMILRTV